MKKFLISAGAIVAGAVVISACAGNTIKESDKYIEEVDKMIQTHTVTTKHTESETVTHKEAETTTSVYKVKWTGEILTAEKGVNYGPTGKETYYNLPMDDVIQTMRNLGFDEIEYKYWIRPDGVKMLGDYVMVAANWDYFPLGTIVECSLGTAIVCDTGGFIWMDEGDYWLDIAVVW